MNYVECIEQARGRIGNYCKACVECNGRACRNQMPGPGAKGIGDTAMRNYDKWKEIRVQMDTIVENAPVDTSLKLFGKEFKCELDECSDFPVATDDYINQFRSHAIYCNDIIGYFDIPLENRYFMSTQELETYVYKESENKYKMSPQELFDQKVVKFVEHFGLKHPPTQRLV